MTARHDLDETRRLLYMALMVPHTEQYELAGTIVNALAHHVTPALDAEDVMTYLLGLWHNDDPHDIEWARQQIALITREIDSWVTPSPPSAGHTP